MKIVLALLSVLLVHFAANADAKLDKGKLCIKEKIAFTGATLLPVEIRASCRTPIRIEASSAREGEEAEFCVTQGDKDNCKVYLYCDGDGQAYRFSVDAKVKYPQGIIGKGLSAVGLGPSCQLSDVSVGETEQ